MEKVVIAKRGIRGMHWEDGDWRDDSPQPSSLIILRVYCEIEEGVTLAELLSLVEQDFELARFLGVYLGCSIAGYFAEASRPCGEPADLSFLEVGKYFDWDEIEGRVSIEFNGAIVEDDGRLTGCGIDFTPLNELAHLTVRLAPNIEIEKDQEKIGEAPCTYSLLDVLSGIYSELTFYGGATERERECGAYQDAMDPTEPEDALAAWTPPKGNVN